MSSETATKETTALPKATASTTPTADVEAAVKKILANMKQNQVEAAKPKEPDWSKVTDADVGNLDFYIPVIEHETPEYLTVQLKDDNYLAIWAFKDQRRTGQLLAEGYEYIKPEHFHPNFKVPLLMDSNGTYSYGDLICVRVHKSIIFGKRRKAFELSVRQLRNNHRPPSVRVKDTFELSNAADPDFGQLYTRI